jgi:sugar phosphate isomerase/epimerase
MHDIKRMIQVNVSFSRLWDGRIDYFTRNGLNPEIVFDARALERFSRADFSAVAETLRKSALTVTFHAPFVDLSAGSSDPAVREVTRRRFEELLALVPLFRPVTVVAHAGYDWKRYEYFRDEWLANSLEFWSWLSDALSREGSRLMLENVYEQGPEEIRVLFEQLSSRRVGLCLDCGHLTVFGGAPLAEWLASLGGFIGQLHLHDNLGKKDDHLPMGRGRIDFSRLFAYLKAERTQPPVMTLEVHSPDDDMRESLECLERLWPW